MWEEHTYLYLGKVVFGGPESGLGKKMEANISRPEAPRYNRNQAGA